MYLILDKMDVVIYTTPTAETLENGNVRVDRGSFDFAGILVGSIVEVETLPEGYADHKYCYIGGQWQPNPKYQPPTPPVNEIEALKARIADLEATQNVILGVN